MSRSTPFAVFRADGGATIGGGHIVRCRALATALQGAGWRCGLVADAGTLDYFHDLSAGFEEMLMLSGDEAPAMAARWPDGCDLLVVDHYGRDAAFEAACRPWAHRVLAIDDLPDRPHCCDLLLDGTPGRAPAAYRELVPEACTLMLGPDYAPLRPEFAPSRRRLLPRAAPKPPWRVLVTLGAAPNVDLMLGIVDGLEASGLDLSVDVAVGANMAGAAALRARLEATSGALHIATDEMATLIENADIAIGAAGMSGWERCCLGLPSIVLVLAENQQANASALARAGAARLLTAPLDPAAVAVTTREILTDAEVWNWMSAAASRLCDGLGAARTVAAIEPPAQARDGAAIRLRPVAPADEEIIFTWQQHPDTRRFARNLNAPNPEEHRDWFAAKRADPRCLFNMVLHGGAPAGILRLDRMDDPEAYEVSVSVAPERHRAGIGRAALDLARGLVSDAAFWAYVKPENAASLALFRAAGYAPSDRTDWYVIDARGEAAHD